MTSFDRARAARKRHTRERQAILLGAIVAALAVIGAGAAAILTDKVELGALNVPFGTKSAAITPGAALPPCLTGGTLPIAYNSITINIFNGTTRAGLAKGASEALVKRAFAIASTGNAPTPETGTARLVFGNAGIAQAYTLAAHIPSATMVLDPRTDASVDLVLGSEWKGLIPLDSVSIDPNVPLMSPKPCTPVADLVAAFPAPTDDASDADDGSGIDDGSSDAATDPAADQG